MFILGDADDSREREPFYHTIDDLLDMELPCRVLFIMREDYFGAPAGMLIKLPKVKKPFL